jgi:hypothetical protein
MRLARGAQDNGVMRTIWAAFVWLGAAGGQELVMEAPRVGQIDFYGLKRVSAERIQKEAGLSVGMALPRSQPELVERIAAIKDVVQASVEAVCCENNRAVLYVGVEEKGGAHFDIREPSPVDGEPMLPAELLDAHQQLLTAIANAARQGEAAEDISRGHSLWQDETARGWQLRVQQLAEPNADLLRKTLRVGTDEERAVAAVALGYVEDKKSIVNDLQFAMRDPDPTVRANALRSLLPVIQLGVRQPAAGVRVEYTWIVETLYSVFFQDRQNALRAMLVLTESESEARPRELLRERALEPLAEMARWRHLPHALPAFLLLGRAVGRSDAEMQEEWVKGDRAAVVERLLKEQRKR